MEFQQYDEAHRVPANTEQVQADLRVGRKWNDVVMTPAGSGMSMMSMRKLTLHAAAGAVGIADAGPSDALAAPKNKPFYRQFDKRKF